MGRGTLRGVFVAWLSLIALDALANPDADYDGAGRVAGFFKDTAGLVRRVMDPTVPAIPDLRLSATERERVRPQSASTPGAPSPSPTPAWKQIPVPNPDRYRNVPE